MLKSKPISKGRSQEKSAASARRLTPHRMLLIALALLAALPMAPIVTHDFVSIDDQTYITRNDEVRTGLTASNVQWALTTDRFSNWHPLTWLSLMLDVEMFGMWAGGHHLTNLLLHVANTLLLYLVWLRLIAAGSRRAPGDNAADALSPYPAALVAALFAVHPLHVESVAWASERKDTLSTLFWLLTMWAYEAYVARPSWRRYVAIAASLALGLMAKPMLVTLPAVLLLLDYWPLRRWQPRSVTNSGEDGVGLPRLLLEKLPLAALVAGSSMITVAVQRRGGALKEVTAYPVDGRIWNAALAYATYLWKAIWPVDLVFFYPYPEIEFLQRGWREPRLLLSVAVLLTITALCLVGGRLYRYLAVGWLWFLGTLVPVIGLVQVGEQALADRYTYVPLIGLFVIAAWGIPELLVRWHAHRKWLAAMALASLVACSVLTVRQQATWRNSRTLYEHALAVTSRNHVALYNLGVLEVEAGHRREALALFTGAVAANPAMVRAHFNLALELDYAGRRAEATAQYEEALAIEPKYARARFNLGVLLAREGQPVEALNHVRQSLPGLSPSGSTQRKFGELLLRLERNAEARDAYRRSVELDSQNAEGHAGLGIALARLGQSAEARRSLDRALELNPRAFEPHLGLGDLSALAERWEDANQRYQVAAHLDSLAAEACRKLGEIALRFGHTSQAQAYLEESLRRDPGDPRAHFGYSRVLETLGRAGPAEEHRLEADRVALQRGITLEPAQMSPSPSGRGPG